MMASTISINDVAASLPMQLAGVQETAQEYVSALATPAQLLCGLFAFVYIGIGLWGAWSKGEKIDFYRLLRPFSVGLIVVFFSGFVALLQLSIYPLELATASINESVRDTYVEAQNHYLQAANTVRNAMALYEREDLTETEIDPATEPDETASYFVTYKTILRLLSSLTSMALSGMVYFIKVYVVLAGIVLLLIGPFSFALSLLPGFSDNIKHWVTHYLHIAMYVPLSSLVSFMVAVLFSGCLFPLFTQMLAELPSSNYTFSDYQDAEHLQLSIQLITIVFNSIAIALYACIPVFSKWIIRSDSKKNA